MARPLRIEFPGALYHVTSRGNEKKNIFKNDSDRRKFLSYLESATQKHQAVIHAFCLMGNHYHLMLETPEGNISRIMQHINSSYTIYFNKKHDRTGHLLQGRYKAMLVEADAYAAELSRYIHLNPVRAGMTELPEEYRWSSFRFYQEGTEPPWLITDFVLGYFGGNSQAARAEYTKYVHEVLGRTHETPLADCPTSTVLGSEEFINWIKTEHAAAFEANRELPNNRQLEGKPDPEKIREIAIEEFPYDKRLARSAAIFLAHQYTSAKLKEIGALFDLTDSGVARASKRFRNLMEKDEQLKKKIEEIRRKNFIVSNVRV